MLFATLMVKENGIIAGLPLIDLVFSSLRGNVDIEFYVKEGSEVRASQQIASVEGDIKILLTGERTVLISYRD